MRHLLASLLLFATTLLAAQSTIQSIPNQKLIDGSYVSNPDHILDQPTVARIDSILSSLEKENTVQVAVVVVESIGDADVFDFAQELFTSWGIGNKNNDNGVLLLFVNDQRTIRFHTGDGIEGVLPDALCKEIQERYMVPAFRNGDFNGGMLAAVQQIHKVVADPTYAQELKAPSDEVSTWVGFVIFLAIFAAPVLLVVYIIKAAGKKFRDSKGAEETPYPEMRLKRWTWIVEFVAIPVLIVVLFGLRASDDAAGLCFLSLYLYYMITLFHRQYRMKKVINRFLAIQHYHEIVEFLRTQQWYWFLMAVLFPLPFLFYFPYHLARKRIFRNHPRNCQQCKGEMKKLGENAEDEYLTAGQQMEEKLRAVDYDVWKCTSCASVEYWFYLNRHSKYEPCPKCKTIAYYAASRRTVTSPTYSSEGKREEVHLCKFCGQQNKSTYSIPRLVRSTSSSSSSGGSSFSGSSGGSWGGGSSGGGGASSRW